jgi:hypothetical protein
MLSYLQKYKDLPAEMKRKASSPEVMAAIKEMEQSYGINLASIVMRIMVRELTLVDLPRYLVFEHGMNGKQAQKLTEELKEKVFQRMSDYVDVPREKAQNVEESESSPAQAAEIPPDSGPEPPQPSSVYSSSFFFSPEDEEEIKKLSQKLNSGYTGKKDEQSDPVEDKAGAIIKDIDLDMSSRELNDRLKQILITYLKGVRNKVSVKEAMAKPAASGGLELDARTIDSIVEAADRYSQTQQPIQKSRAGYGSDGKAGPIPDEDSRAKWEKLRQGYGERDFKYDFSQMKKPAGQAGEEEKPQASADGSEKTEPEASSEEGAPLGQKPGEASAPHSKPEEPEPRKAESAGQPGPKAKEPEYRDATGAPKVRQAASPGGKKRMDDVKYKPKLTGPIEELKGLTLVDFRRLGNDPQAASRKVADKIEYLAGESYAKKTAGIKAWRQSPVNRLYLEMGQQSVGEHKKIDSIIEKRQEEGLDTLSKSEFMAIMELNKNLRY